MKKFLFLILSALAIAASAENYPYRSDILWVTTPDHADWLYQTGEKATIDIQLYQYGMPVSCKVDYAIAEDMLEAFDKGSVTLKNGRASINIGTRKAPGFRDLALTATVGGKKTIHHVKVGYSVDKIEPWTKEPKDFTAFWDKTKTDFATPVSFTRELATEYCTDKIDCWLVKIKTDNKHHSIYGYLTIPKGAKAGQCPIVICPPGAGIKTIKEPLRHKFYAEQGFMRLETEIHGLDPRISADRFKEISDAFGNHENNYLSNGLDNRDNYYMRHVYQGLVAAIDFMTSLPEWDGKNVAFQGGSQGGALSLIAAALDSRVTQCVANHPALSDMGAYSEKGRTGGYPHFKASHGMLTPDKLQTMAYYDVINFARHITCPVYLTWGYNDNTCPPTTSYAVWNTLTCPKESLITPINEHWTSDNTAQTQMEWIKAHLK